MTSCKCHKLQEGYFSIQRRFCANSNSEKSDPMFPSGRPSLRVRTRWQNRSDAHQCLETLNYSRLYPSKRNDKLSGHYLEFEKILAFQCICLNDVLYRPDAKLSKHHPSRRREISFWTFLCVGFSLHLSGILNSTSGYRSMFNHLWDFFPKHRYEKTAATIRTRRCGFSSGHAHL